MPQHRPNSAQAVIRPAQAEYPVWYLFYGPLAEASGLSMLLCLPNEPHYRPATITGGRYLSWNAIAGTDPYQIPNKIWGMLYLVVMKKHEDSVRFSAIDKFEVVRCKIKFVDSGKVVDGLTLRYIGGDIQ